MNHAQAFQISTTSELSPFSPERPHLSVALVLNGTFMQLADPLDWAVARLGLSAKVDRVEFMESLANHNHGPASAATPIAEARSTDRHTQFKLEVIGRCEGHMVAQCRITFNPLQHTLKGFEDAAHTLVVLNAQLVLGVQGTAGDRYHTLAPLERPKEKTYLRLLPLNVFNRSFFASQIKNLRGDAKLACTDLAQAELVTLTKAWLFYDVPLPRRKAEDAAYLLPFRRG